MNRLALSLSLLTFAVLSVSLGAFLNKAPGLKEAKELLSNVCAGGAMSGRCTPCPPFVEGAGDEMSLEAVNYGKFFDNENIYALLDLSGCEPHVNNFGGSVLLKWQGLTRWSFVKYAPGLRSNDCLKYPVQSGSAQVGSAQGGREILLCEGFYGGMGTRVFSLSTLDLAAQTRDETLVYLEDTTAACLETVETVSAQHLDGWQQVRINADALPDLRVRVSSGVGRRENTPKDCEDEKLSISSRVYILEFIWNGVKFTPTPATRTALKAIGKDNGTGGP